MLIGYARVSKVDGSQSLDLQSGVSFLWTPVQLLTASTLHRRTRSTPLLKPPQEGRVEGVGPVQAEVAGHRVEATEPVSADGHPHGDTVW